MSTSTNHQHPTETPRRRWPLAVAAAAGGIVIGLGSTAFAAPAPGDPGDGRFPDSTSSAGAVPSWAGSERGVGGPPFGPRGDRPEPGTLPEQDSSDNYLGRVVDLSGTRLVIRTDAGEEVDLQVTGDTRIDSGPESILTSEDLSDGLRVAVRSTDGQAERVNVVRAHVTGTVTAVSGDTITVVDRHGFNHAIDLSGSTATGFTVGQVVRALGYVDSDGTTLRASAAEQHDGPVRPGR